MPKFLAAIDLQKNELRNARVQNLATAPSSPVAGQVYYNTVDNKLYYWDGTIWQAGSGATGAAGGELAGSYPNPTVADGVIDNANISATANIALSKLATDPLARANHTGTQPAATVVDFDDQVHTSSLDELATAAGDYSMGGFALTSLADPVDDQDAATKSYVDASAQGLDVKLSVKAATTADITLFGPQSLDGVPLVADDRALVKNQTVPEDNGIYVVKVAAWVRADDANADTDVTPGMYTFVEQGALAADSGWILTTDAPIVLGTTGLVFTQFSGTGQITAGTGLTKTGNSLDAVGTTNRISVSADAIDISTDYVGQASITTLGTVATGTWEGDPVDVAFGGTGATNAVDARSNLGAVSKFVGLNDGTSSDVIVHGLGTEDVTVSVRLIATGELLNATYFVTDANTVTVEYDIAPTIATLRIAVIG